MWGRSSLRLTRLSRSSTSKISLKQSSFSVWAPWTSISWLNGPTNSWMWTFACIWRPWTGSSRRSCEGLLPRSMTMKRTLSSGWWKTSDLSDWKSSRTTEMSSSKLLKRQSSRKCCRAHPETYYLTRACNQLVLSRQRLSWYRRKWTPFALRSQAMENWGCHCNQEKNKTHSKGARNPRVLQRNLSFPALDRNTCPNLLKTTMIRASPTNWRVT